MKGTYTIRLDVAREQWVCESVLMKERWQLIPLPVMTTI